MSPPRIDGAAPRHTQARVAAGRPFHLALNELDLDLLDAICGLRVVTPKQLERLHGGVPPRTLRYRTRRLHQAGLIGRTRPYRDRGTAPYYLWPTNRADALARGTPPARRGERRAPNPLFLAHAAALSELYVVLCTAPPDAGWTLAEFGRERAAREDFRDAAGRPRAIVPDALVTLQPTDATCGPLLANVELDLGTMTHARLRSKLRGYLAHANWRARIGVADAPTLLFITTSDARRDQFVDAAAGLQQQARGAARAVRIAATATARRLDTAVSTACWRAVGSHAPLALASLAGDQPERHRDGPRSQDLDLVQPG
jgi:Replication-relaxation